MKEVLDPAAPRQGQTSPSDKPARVRVETVITEPGSPSEGESFANRKLIRPSLPSRGDRSSSQSQGQGQGERGGNAGDRTLSASKKPAPPDLTFAEGFYYQKQMQARTPMVVVLADGEEFRGIVEWYDRDCIKLNRTGGHANLLIYKAHIKYVFKDEGKR